MLRLFQTNKNLRKEIVQLTLPVMAEQSFITLMGVINSIMAGHIGKEAAAAIGMIDSLNVMFIAAFSSLAVGGTIIVAHYTGANDPRNAGETSKQALYAGLILSALIAVLVGVFRHPLLQLLFGSADPEVFRNALDYLAITLYSYPLIALTSVACGVLRGAGDTRTPAKVVILMNIINIIFSFLLIFGFAPLHFNGFGVAGAAWGIAIARFTGGIVLIYILFRGSGNLRIRRIFHFRPDWVKLQAILNIGVPSSIESLLFSSGKLITQTFIVPLGTVAIVANYVANSLHTMMIIPGQALGIAATTLVGQNMGRGECNDARCSLDYLTKISSIGLAALNIAFIPIFPFLASLYSTNHEIIALAALLMRITAFFLVFWSFSFLLPAGLKGAGDVRYTLAVSGISMWIFRISLGYIFCVQLQWGVIGIWMGMYFDWLIRSVAFYLRFKGPEWQKKVIIKATPKTA